MNSRPIDNLHLELGKLLQAARQKKGMSKQQLAEHLGIDDVRRVHQWEEGTCSLPMSFLYHVCKELMISDDEISRVMLANCKIT